MRRLILIALLSFAATANLQARLEETEQQCDARYGKPTVADHPTPGSDKTVTYHKDGVTISVEFVKGRCQQISYRGTSSQEEVDVLIKANTGGRWANYSGGSKQQFVRSDGLAKAQQIPDYPTANPMGMTFTLNVWEDAHKRALQDTTSAQKAAEAQNAQKFKKDF